MTYSYNYAELLGREMLRQRRQEAEKERLIRQVTRRESSAGKIWRTVQSKLNDLWALIFKKKGYIKISGVPRNSTSL